MKLKKINSNLTTGILFTSLVCVAWGWIGQKCVTSYLVSPCEESAGGRKTCRYIENERGDCEWWNFGICDHLEQPQPLIEGKIYTALCTEKKGFGSSVTYVCGQRPQSPSGTEMVRPVCE